MKKQMSAVQWLLAKLRFATSFAASAAVNFGGIGAILGERAVFAGPRHGRADAGRSGGCGPAAWPALIG